MFKGRGLACILAWPRHVYTNWVGCGNRWTHSRCPFLTRFASILHIFSVFHKCTIASWLNDVRRVVRIPGNEQKCKRKRQFSAKFSKCNTDNMCVCVRFLYITSRTGIFCILIFCHIGNTCFMWLCALSYIIRGKVFVVDDFFLACVLYVYVNVTRYVLIPCPNNLYASLCETTPKVSPTKLFPTR